MEKIVCIIQARMSSSRLPGKVLIDIGGQPMLGWVVRRVQRSRKIDQVVVATTTDASDDPIVEFCQAGQIACFRGSLFDVLDRYYQAAKEYKADIIVRVTADCPLIDPQLVDQVIEELQNKHLDFTANRLPPPFKRTYPIGLDVEVTTIKALTEAWQNAKLQHEREHVMPYLYSGSVRYQVGVVNAEQDYGSQRWTVDTPQDLIFVQKVVELLEDREDFTWRDILQLVLAHPELAEINVDVRHKSYDDIDERSQR
jgi:spore coat polysaccharide biosynthesis protein SpsF